MGFVQIIKLTTDRLDDLEAAHDDWLAATEGQRTVTREMVCENRDRPGEYWMIVEFPDHEAAMKNNDLPATNEISGRLAALATGAPEFVNLDLIRTDGA